MRETLDGTEVYSIRIFCALLAEKIIQKRYKFGTLGFFNNIVGVCKKS